MFINNFFKFKPSCLFFKFLYLHEFVIKKQSIHKFKINSYKNYINIF